MEADKTVGKTDVVTPEKPHRPFKLTKDVVNKLEQAFSLDCTISEACVFAGISRETYYNWIEFWPRMKERFDMLREKPILKARNTLVAALDKPKYALKYLERKRKKEFAPRTELTDGEGKPLQTNAITFVQFNDPKS